MSGHRSTCSSANRTNQGLLAARPERKTRQNVARQGPCGAVRVNLTYLFVLGVTVEDGFAEPVLLDERVADGDGIPTVAIRLFVGSAAALHKVQLAKRTSGLVGERGQRHSVGRDTRRSDREIKG